MGEKIYENKFLWFFVSLLMLALSIAFVGAGNGWMILPFISIISVLNKLCLGKTVKSLNLFILGIAAVLVVASSFSLQPDISFFFLLAAVNATAALVAYSDNKIYAAIFAFPSIAMIFTAGGLGLLNGRIDLLIISSSLFSISVLVFPQLLERSKGAGETALGAITAAFVSSMLLSTVYLIFAYVGGLQLATIEKFLWNLLGNTTWYAFVANAFLSCIFIIIYELMLYALNMKRIVDKDGIKYSHSESDPYVELANEMRKYSIEAENATSGELLRKYTEFKCEYDGIKSVRETHSKKEVGKLMRDMERKISREEK